MFSQNKSNKKKRKFNQTAPSVQRSPYVARKKPAFSPPSAYCKVAVRGRGTCLTILRDDAIEKEIRNLLNDSHIHLSSYSFTTTSILLFNDQNPDLALLNKLLKKWVTGEKIFKFLLVKIEQAIESSEHSVVKRIFTHKDKLGYTILNIASHTGNVDAVDRLLKQGEKVFGNKTTAEFCNQFLNNPNNAGATPLSSAKGHVRIVNLLRNYGALQENKSESKEVSTQYSAHFLFPKPQPISVNTARVALQRAQAEIMFNYLIENIAPQHAADFAYDISIFYVTQPGFNHQDAAVRYKYIIAARELENISSELDVAENKQDYLKGKIKKAIKKFSEIEPLAFYSIFSELVDHLSKSLILKNYTNNFSIAQKILKTKPPEALEATTTLQI